MSQISLKSISGITSITTPAGVDNVFTVHTNDTTEKFRVDQTGNQNISGIVTASNFKTGSSNLHSTGLTVGNNFLHSTGINVGTGATIHVPATNVLTLGTNSNERLRISSSGKVGIDMTNPDAYDKFVVSGTGNVIAARATSGAAGLGFYENNTGRFFIKSLNGSDGISFVDADNSTERLRIGSSGQIGLSGANYGTSGQVLTSQGSGSAVTWSTISGTTINSNSDNRVITGSGTANTLNAESTFTHDPSACDTSIIHNSNNPADLIIQNNSGGTGANARLTLTSGSNSNAGPMIELNVGSDSWTFLTPKTAGNLDINDNGSLAFRMAGDGDFHIVDGDLVISTAGHGIDFSATSDAAGGTSELLDDYEEGSWTPTVIRSNNSGVSGSYVSQAGVYTKIGRLVHLAFAVDIQNFSGGAGHVGMGGLPFQVGSNGLPGWPHSAHLLSCYLDSEYAGGVDARSVIFTGSSYGYVWNIDDGTWEYGTYSRVKFRGQFTYMI